MSKYPTSIDDDVSLPRVNNNIVDVGEEAINALREAVFNIETEIGVGLSGTSGTLASRLGVSINTDGTIKASALTGLGLVTLPIYDSQIALAAGIKESKLDLDYSTSDLNNKILVVSNNADIALSFINNTGSKIQPHIDGTTYRHVLNHIDVSGSTSEYFKNKDNLNRDNSDVYNLLNDINNDLISHEKADGTDFGLTNPYESTVGTVPPDNYAHVAEGLYLNPSNFSFIPQTITDLQSFAQFIDNSNIFILGTRIQTFYSNGISKSGRSASLLDNDRGQPMVSYTPVITYLLNNLSTSVVDDIDFGDDIVEFKPDATSISNSSFDAKFNSIKIGDILTVNYSTFIVPFIIKEKKIVISGLDKKYIVRINGKNLIAGTYTAKVDKPLYNPNKYGVLALAECNSLYNSDPSLIVGNPRSAELLGIGFKPTQIDSKHYNLYIALYPDGNPNNQVISLPAIDISGNQGTTPGKYTLESIVTATNNSLRKAGYNLRFMAYSYNGDFGLIMTDPYGNASFSVISGVLNTVGNYDTALSATLYQNNVIEVGVSDCLGIGPSGSNAASPPFSATFVNSDVAKIPTKIFVPLKRNNYYVNGVERERFGIEPLQSIDGYGDSYWEATIINKSIIPGTRIEVTYQIDQVLSTSGLKPGKTLVVQGSSSNTYVNYGRFIIKDVQFTDCDGYAPSTTITVYDAIHGTGSSPFSSAAVGTTVNIYFNSDSVGFNSENSSDFSTVSNFKRHFEIFINENGYTFSHERARLNLSGTNVTVNSVTLYQSSELANINLYKVSPKLKGYNYSSVNKINLYITSYTQNTGVFTGYLCAYDGTTRTNLGPTITGKKGEIVRFYDETNIDYIDFIFDLDTTIASFTNKTIDIQLFPTLSLDEEVMLIGTVQLNNSTKELKYLRDERQFGNISEKQLSNSVFDYIAVPNDSLSDNFTIKGFDLVSITNGKIVINGGSCLIGGKVLNINNDTLNIPVIQETLVPYGNANVISTLKWFLCVNDKNEFEFLPSTDYDVAASTSTYVAAGVDQDRIFNALNPNSSLVYPIKATYLSDIILNKRKLNLIGLITSTVGLSGSTYVVTASSYKDMRVFAKNPLTERGFSVGSDHSFKNMTVTNSWLNELTNYVSYSLNKISNKVHIRDTVSISGLTLGYGGKTIFYGSEGKFTISSNTTINSNAEFIDLTFEFSSTAVLTMAGSNLTFKNCRFNLQGVSNKITITGTNIVFDGCTFDVVGKTGIELNSNFVTITNSTINYSYDSSADGDYDTAVPINTASGCIYSTIGDSIRKNIILTNNKVNFSTEDHFPFVSFVATDESSYHENIKIDNNQFNNSIVGEDLNCIISFTTTLLTAPTLGSGPKLVDVSISKNSSNKDSNITISSPLNGSTKIANMFVPINVNINENLVGTISFFTRKDIASVSVNTTRINNKNSSLFIKNNNCRLIYNGFSNGFMNSTGSFSPSTLNAGLILSGSSLYTSNLIISENEANWIYIGVRRSTDYVINPPRVVVENNSLTAYDVDFLNNFIDGITLPAAIGLFVNGIVGT